MRVVDEEILKKEGNENWRITLRIQCQSGRIDSIDFPQIYCRFCRRKLFQNVPSHPTTSVDTLFNSTISDFSSLCSQATTATAVAISNNDAVLSRCPSALFPRVSTFRYLTSQAVYKNICRIIFCQSKLWRTLMINDTTAWTMLQQTCSYRKLTRARCVLVYLHFNQVELFNKGKCISRSMLLCLLKIIMREWLWIIKATYVAVHSR